MLGTVQAVPATSGHSGEQGERLQALPPQAILQVGGWDQVGKGLSTNAPLFDLLLRDSAPCLQLLSIASDTHLIGFVGLMRPSWHPIA